MSVFTSLEVIQSPEFQKKVLQDHLKSVRRWRVDTDVARRFIKHNIDTESLHDDAKDVRRTQNTQQEEAPPTVRRSLRLLVKQVTVENKRSTFGVTAQSDVWLQQGHQSRLACAKQIQKKKRSAALQKLRNQSLTEAKESQLCLEIVVPSVAKTSGTYDFAALLSKA